LNIIAFGFPSGEELSTANVAGSGETVVCNH